LGVDGAFTSAGFDSSSDWRFKTHLANMPLYFEMLADHITGQPKTLKGTYLNQYKNIFDLYLNDSTTPRTQLSGKTADDANSEFATGKAVFYQNGTWAWSDLQKSGFKAGDLGMMPLYIGAGDEKNQGLTTGSENYWCINSKVSAADQKATEAFLKWMVTNKKGQDALAKDMGFVTPFKSMENIKSENPLTQIAQEDAKSGKKDVTWNFTIIPSTKWKDDLGSALLAYAQGTGTWDSVKKAFVDGWKTEYDATH
ncbi:MAG: extracellular solute-binding protein, partial [Scardovia wiggsiae]|nr:extracellular solute-binding protein [Scardovia wiggsiae]